MKCSPFLWAGLLASQIVVVRAATPMTTFTGSVADSAGKPLSGVTVTLRGDGLAALLRTTDEHGRYRFPAVPPHHVCSIGAAHEGYRAVLYEGLMSEPGRTRSVNFRLKRPGEVEVAALVSRDPFPDEEFVKGFAARVGVPVRIVDLDREVDAAAAVRAVRAEHPNLIIGTGLRAARLIRREVLDIPSLLALVTDPRRQGLQSETTGLLTSQPEAERVVAGLAGILPSMRRIGLLYSADTSVLLARDLMDAAEKRGLSVELRLCRSPDDVGPALVTLRNRIDVLVVPNDDLTATETVRHTVTSWSVRERIPLAAPSPDWVRGGALLSYGASYERLGEEAARIATRILQGGFAPSEVPNLRLSDFEPAMNRVTADRLRVPIPVGLSPDALY